MDQQKFDRLGVDLARQQTKMVRELKEIRVSSGLTVAEVAASMGVDEAVVYRFEKGGTNPTLATVRRYALTVGAMLDLGATSVIEHTRKAVRHAADSIEHDPVKRAGFVKFHAIETADNWLTASVAEVPDERGGAVWASTFHA